MRQHASRQFWQPMLWLALCVAICNAIAPSAMRIAVVVHGDRFVEICSSFGIKRLPAGLPGDGSIPGKADSPGCKICLAGNSPCIPAAVQIHTAAGELRAVHLPAAHEAARLGHHAWRAARPRAPPPLA